ncbi:MAG: DUF2917 domain-containing protein [Janthinobacterium lividum]
MKKLFARDGLTLGPGMVRQVVLGQAGNLQVVRGRLWVTVVGQMEDHWHAAGQTLPLDRHAQIVIEAVDGDAILTLAPVASPAASAALGTLRRWMSLVSRCSACPRSTPAAPALLR